MKTFVAINPADGRHMRLATADESNAYASQPGMESFRKPIKAGDVIIDEWTGFGINSISCPGQPWD